MILEKNYRWATHSCNIPARMELLLSQLGNGVPAAPTGPVYRGRSPQMHRKPPLQVDWYGLHRPLGPQKHLHVQVLLSLHPLLPLHLREFSPARTSKSQLQIRPDRASTWQSAWEAASAPALATDSPAALPVCTSLLLQLHWSCLGPGTQPSLRRQTPSQLLERGPDRSLQPT